MITKIKNNKTQIIEITIIFILTLLYNLICNEISNDEVWNYGFAYNISKGLIPYKDFNMVITPFFPLLGAIFLTVFGKSILIYHIFNSIICTILFQYMKKRIPKAYYILYGIFLIFSLPNYNILCMLLLYVLMDLEDKKSNDFIIGIVLGIVFLTKQNIGIYLCIPTLFKKDIKAIIKRIIGFTIPNIIIITYLVLNNCFYEFIDYVFLGINSFAKKNLVIDKTCLVMIIIGTIYLIYQYINKKDIKIIYLLCFQLVVIPLIEPYHTMIAIIPTIGYFLSTLKLHKQTIIIAFMIFIITSFLWSFNSFNKKEYMFPNNTTEFKYRKIIYQDDMYIKEIIKLIKPTEDRLYIICGNAYLFKLEANIKINKYDLLNNGNLGKNGEQKLIDQIEKDCKKENCIFMIAKRELLNNQFNQYNKDIIKYIMNNYNEIDEKYNFIIYKNY